jgi:hypothetical protein
MISKDADLISEAYLSAVQKNHNFAPDPAMDSVAEVNPELTDRENVESPVAMTVSVPAGPEAMGAMDQGSGCGCHQCQIKLTKSLKNIGWFVQTSSLFIQTPRRFIT